MEKQACDNACDVEEKAEEVDASRRLVVGTLRVPFFLPFFAYLSGHSESSMKTSYHASSSSDSSSDRKDVLERWERGLEA